METEEPGPRLRARGKVRDVYDRRAIGLLVATDRISAFDVVLPEPIPDKGRVLTGLSLFWFERTADLVRNQVLSADLRLPAPSRGSRRSPARRDGPKADVIPIECVARGYLSGSGGPSTERRVGSAACRCPPAPGVRPPPRPIFADHEGRDRHDPPLTPDDAIELAGRGSSSGSRS